ncbi:MAG: CYTH domain-containing protein [Candidatus Kerfeldbacteria bacterium]|nr:CYTH domain-containing protein [Candidatus Kerfeldbacteria bacterium]
MQTELEAKFLNVDPDATRAKLRETGAELVHPERLMRRKSFDDSQGHLDRHRAWVRVRDEGDKITMSYKQSDEDTLHGTQETVLTVDDFERACAFLEEVGLVAKSYQETKREKWMLDNVEITIDTWPWLPTFVELEGHREEDLKSVAGSLGLEWSAAIHGGVTPVYKRYYDVTYDEVNSWPQIVFGPVPDWLERKRKKV